MKLACSECATLAGSTVRLAAISAWATTCPPNTLPRPPGWRMPRNRSVSSVSTSSNCRSRSIISAGVGTSSIIVSGP
jgi:hypothetical protein